MMTNRNRHRGISATIHKIGYAILVFNQAFIWKKVYRQTASCIDIEMIEEDVMRDCYGVNTIIIATADKGIGTGFI